MNSYHLLSEVGWELLLCGKFCALINLKRLAKEDLACAIFEPEKYVLTNISIRETDNLLVPHCQSLTVNFGTSYKENGANILQKGFLRITKLFGFLTVAAGGGVYCCLPEQKSDE